ncbi:MAG: SIR2 family protein [Halothermotrichaceae bacterium]
MTQSISFLFGSGASLAAEIPSTEDITKKIMSGQSYYASTCNRYIPVSASTKEDKRVVRTVQFLKLIAELVTPYLNKEKCNYEDLFYVIKQILGGAYNRVNPVVMPFLNQVKEKIAFEEWTLYEYFDNARKYIIDTIYYLLSRKTAEINYLKFIGDIVRNEGIKRVDIFTLNHDIIIEKYLTMHDIDYCDGFQQIPVAFKNNLANNNNYNKNKLQHNKIRKWEPHLFIETSADIRLLKLHGSINWYKIPDKNSCRGYIYGSCSFENTMQYISLRPLLLIGKYNKVNEYNSNIYVDLHYYFYRLLKMINTIIISGYSFGDTGINSWLIDWMDSRRDHSIVLITPRVKKCINQAGHDIKKQLLQWQKKERLRTIAIPLEKLDWSKHADFILK